VADLARDRARATSAMAQLLRLHQERVWRLAYHLTSSAAAADDVTQETFLRLYRSAGKYKPTAALPTFLHRIVVNLCIDARRTGHPALALSSLGRDPPGRAADDPVEQTERAQQVRAALEALPQRQRTAVILHRYEDLSYEQIAHAMDISESAVESLIMRGYAELRRRLASLQTA
jgi:RNA polymerase sigma-70 factor (ECF subfamily)